MFRPYVNFFISVVAVRDIRFTCFNNDDNNDFFLYICIVVVILEKLIFHITHDTTIIFNNFPQKSVLMDICRYKCHFLSTRENYCLLIKYVKFYSIISNIND